MLKMFLAICFLMSLQKRGSQVHPTTLLKCLPDTFGFLAGFAGAEKPGGETDVVSLASGPTIGGAKKKFRYSSARLRRRLEYWAEINHFTFHCIGLADLPVLALLLPQYVNLLELRIIKEYERAVIFRLGRIMDDGSAGPGLIFIMPCVDKFQKVDLRLFTYNVPPQEILSKDSVTVNVDAVVYFRIASALLSVVNVTNADYSTQLLAQSTLRNILGTKTLSEILTDRVSIAHQIQDTLDEATERWGVKVERVEVKNVRLPEQLQRAMAAEAEATRNAKAEVIAAEGEHKASRALRDAAAVMSESKYALHLRYLQTVNSIAGEKESTILFPVPINIMGNLQGVKRKTINPAFAASASNTVLPASQGQAQARFASSHGVTESMLLS